MFGNLAFTVILIASSLSNVGIAMFDTSMSWLMTSLNPDPMMVSAVQVATMLPMFLLTVPAGALADIVDSRRLLIGAQAGGRRGLDRLRRARERRGRNAGQPAADHVCARGRGRARGAGLAARHAEAGGEGRPRQRDRHQQRLLQRQPRDRPGARRLAIAALSIDVPFWSYCAGNLAIVAAVLWWRAPRRVKETLPAERFASAVRTGLRYVRHNRAMDGTLIRAVAFFLFGSAYWALLPLVARSQLHNGAATFGILLGMIGFGSLAGSLGLGRLKERLGPDRLAGLATVGTIAALAMYGAAHALSLALAASFIAGACWTIMMTTLFVSAQVALPDWVRGRGMAILLTAYFGAMTIGSAVWGKVASHWGLPMTLYVAAAGALVAMIATWSRKLQTAAALDLTPSHALARPGVRPARRRRPGAGAGLGRVPYRPQGPGGFPRRDAGDRLRAEARRRLRLERVRGTRQLGRVVETFLIQSLLELRHLRPG